MSMHRITVPRRSLLASTVAVIAAVVAIGWAASSSDPGGPVGRGAAVGGAVSSTASITDTPSSATSVDPAVVKQQILSSQAAARSSAAAHLTVKAKPSEGPISLAAPVPIAGIVTRAQNPLGSQLFQVTDEWEGPAAAGSQWLDVYAGATRDPANLSAPGTPAVAVFAKRPPGGSGEDYHNLIGIYPDTSPAAPTQPIVIVAASGTSLTFSTISIAADGPSQVAAVVAKAKASLSQSDVAFNLVTKSFTNR